LSTLPYRPSEELARLEARGFTIDNTGGKVSVHHPVFGEMASKPANVYRRQLHEVDLQRALLEFARAHRQMFTQWLDGGIKA
jgi:hypothetical protein